MKFNRGILRAAFSTAQAARLSGLSPRQLDYWDRCSFLGPSLARAAGYGSARRYSFRDLVLLRVASRLRSAGFGLQRIRRALATLQRLDPSRKGIAEARILISGTQVLWARSDRELVDILNEGQLLLVFPLGEVVRSVAAAVEDLGRDAELETALPSVPHRPKTRYEEVHAQRG